MTWWWIGLTDENKPRGQRAIGALIVEHPGPESAIEALARDAGFVAPGVDCLFGEIASSWGAPPVGHGTRCWTPCHSWILVTAEQAEALAKAWDTGHRGLADADDIKRAFLDDDAKDGDPLFKRST